MRFLVGSVECVDADLKQKNHQILVGSGGFRGGVSLIQSFKKGILVFYEAL